MGPDEKYRVLQVLTRLASKDTHAAAAIDLEKIVRVREGRRERERDARITRLPAVERPPPRFDQNAAPPRRPPPPQKKNVRRNNRTWARAGCPTC